jgi:transcriptional regulator with XRE-family HTH domain
MTRWRGMPANGHSGAVVQRDQELAAAIRRLRMERGLTQEHLAFEADLTTSSLARVERGEADPHWTTLLRILAALGTSLTDLAAVVEDEARGSTDPAGCLPQSLSTSVQLYGCRQTAPQGLHHPE